MPEYKSTWFDKHGADGALALRTLPYAVIGFVFAFGSILAVSGFHWWTLPVGIIAGLGVGYLPILLGHGAGRTYQHFMMDGSSTPYAEQYSYQQSLVMRGEIDAALESFEAVIASEPTAVSPRVKAAELYLRERQNHTRSAELFRDIQRIPTISTGEDVFATNRLVDLLIGPLNDPGRALVELRRLVERYPNTPAAENARQALATLKARMNSPQ